MTSRVADCLLETVFQSQGRVVVGFGGAVVVAIAGGGLVVAFYVGEATGKSRTALPAAPMSTMPSDTATDVPRDAIDMPSPA